MTTTSAVIKGLADVIEKKIVANQIFWPAGRDLQAAPTVHRYVLPLNQDREEKNKPYIIIKFDEETQEINDPAGDESLLKLELIVGVCSDSEDVQTGMECIAAAVEWLEIELKNTMPIDDWAVLKRVKKKIPLEQPIPVYQGYLRLEYSYYKPIARMELEDEHHDYEENGNYGG